VDTNTKVVIPMVEDGTGSILEVVNTSQQVDARAARKYTITILRSAWVLAKLLVTKNGNNVMPSTINLNLAEQALFNLIHQTKLLQLMMTLQIMKSPSEKITKKQLLQHSQTLTQQTAHH
jgi:hypothetical protein